MNKVTVLVAATITALSLLAGPAPVKAADKPPIFKPNGTLTVLKPDVALSEFRLQMLDKRTPSLAYWAAVSKCEVNGNWQDSGTWAGGLGIYTKGRFRDSNMGTWERWGGEEFASHPSKATIIQQVVVANRIAIFGYKTKVTRRDGSTYIWSRPGVGFFGWGCIANNSYLHPKKWGIKPSP